MHCINNMDPEPVRLRFSSDEDYASWLAARKKNALYDIPVEPDVKDQVLVLTTCVFPEDPDDWRNEIAAYAIIRKVRDGNAPTSAPAESAQPPA